MRFLVYALLLCACKPADKSGRTASSDLSAIFAGGGAAELGTEEMDFSDGFPALETLQAIPSEYASYILVSGVQEVKNFLGAGSTKLTRGNDIFCAEEKITKDEIKLLGAAKSAFAATYGAEIPKGCFSGDGDEDDAVVKGHVSMQYLYGCSGTNDIANLPNKNAAAIFHNTAGYAKCAGGSGVDIYLKQGVEVHGELNVVPGDVQHFRLLHTLKNGQRGPCVQRYESDTRVRIERCEYQVLRQDFSDPPVVLTLTAENVLLDLLTGQWVEGKFTYHINNWSGETQLKDSEKWDKVILTSADRKVEKHVQDVLASSKDGAFACRASEYLKSAEHQSLIVYYIARGELNHLEQAWLNGEVVTQDTLQRANEAQELVLKVPLLRDNKEYLVKLKVDGVEKNCSVTVSGTPPSPTPNVSIVPSTPWPTVPVITYVPTASPTATPSPTVTPFMPLMTPPLAPTPMVTP